MILILEIIIVIIAIAAFLASAAILGRNAMSFGRTAQRLQTNLTPQVDKISTQAGTARELGFRLMDRAGELERRSATLSVSMNRMKVLTDAAAEAKQKLDRVTGYIGL